MKKYSFALLNIIIFTSLKGQALANKKGGLPYDMAEQVKVTQMSIDQRKEGWVYKGTNFLLINQTSFSN